MNAQSVSREGAVTNSGDYDLIADLYDHTIHYAARPDIDFYIEQTREVAGPILELGCGTGRILLPLAEAGHEMIGMDIADQMLDRCREKLARLPRAVQDRVRLVHGNMVEIDLDETFPLVTLPFRPFHHLLTIDEQLRCLQSAHRRLDPGGRIILDLFQVDPGEMFDPKTLEETVDFRDVELPDGRKFTRSQRIADFHPDEQYNDIELIHTVTYPDGRRERIVQAFPWRYFFRFEVEHLLARCGFATVCVYGDYDCSPLTKGSPEMIFVAEKDGTSAR